MFSHINQRKQCTVVQTDALQHPGRICGKLPVKRRGIKCECLKHDAPPFLLK